MDKFHKPVFRAGIMIAMTAMLFIANPVFAGLEGVATLYSFSGDIFMKSDGLWGVEPQKGLPVYHGDKFTTAGDSFVRIRFHDGSFLDILPNTNVRVAEIIGDEGLGSQKELKKR